MQGFGSLRFDLMDGVLGKFFEHKCQNAKDEGECNYTRHRAGNSLVQKHEPRVQR